MFITFVHVKFFKIKLFVTGKKIVVLNIHNIYKLQLSYWVPIKTYLKKFLLLLLEILA